MDPKYVIKMPDSDVKRNYSAKYQFLQKSDHPGDDLFDQLAKQMDVVGAQ